MAELSMRAPRAGRVVRRRPGFGGSAGAVVGFCLSLTPSLLPRHWLLQGVLSAITMAIGYGAGATLGALVRAVWPKLPAVPAWGWTGLAGVGTALGVAFLRLGAAWQAELRALVGATADAWRPLPVVATSVALFGLLLLAARGIRLATRRIADTFGRFSPRPVASVAAVGLVAALSYGIGPAMAFPGFVDVAERAAARSNQIVAPELTRPTSPFVSGGPGSLVPWETLGGYGREFAAGAVPPAELAGFAGPGEQVVPPVRVYAGKDSAPSISDRAELAVRELERTGGLRRSVVAVITTTGTGWVNPAVADSLEYLHGGDTALVAMQYSYLPSWISFIADRSVATEAAAALIGAVRDRLAALPAEDRPALVVYGESLGSYGVESAFGDLAGLLAATDGALLVGPPHGNPIWAEVVGHRAPDSPVWRPEPTAAGGGVCFATGAADLPVVVPVADGSPAGPDQPELVYLQHASDPVVWWSPDLLYRQPEWLDEHRGPDVSGAMQWFPVVTFWQVTVDLILSTKAPPGHGHAYRDGVAGGWAALVSPPGWTDQDTARLRDHLR